jgi:hypothetical protein
VGGGGFVGGIGYGGWEMEEGSEALRQIDSVVDIMRDFTSCVH